MVGPAKQQVLQVPLQFLRDASPCSHFHTPCCFPCPVPGAGNTPQTSKAATQESWKSIPTSYFCHGKNCCMTESQGRGWAGRTTFLCRKERETKHLCHISSLVLCMIIWFFFFAQMNVHFFKFSMLSQKKNWKVNVVSLYVFYLSLLSTQHFEPIDILHEVLPRLALEK